MTWLCLVIGAGEAFSNCRPPLQTAEAPETHDQCSATHATTMLPSDSSIVNGFYLLFACSAFGRKAAPPDWLLPASVSGSH